MCAEVHWQAEDLQESVLTSRLVQAAAPFRRSLPGISPQQSWDYGCVSHSWPFHVRPREANPVLLQMVLFTH